MSQATRVHSTPSPLSSLIRDPFVRRAFERAEREDGTAPAVVAVEPRKPLQGGAIIDAEISTSTRRQELADA
jgi:hypothetical protein